MSAMAFLSARILTLPLYLKKFRGVSPVEAREGACEVARILVAQRERGLLYREGGLGQQRGGFLHF